MKTLVWVGSEVGPTFTSEKLTQDYDFSSGPVEVDDGDALELIRLVGRSVQDISELEVLGGGGSSIPKTVTGMYGVVVGSVIDEALEPDPTTGELRIYIKLKRSATGAGTFLGNGAGGAAVSIDGDNVVTVTNSLGVAATTTVIGFTAIGGETVLVVDMNGEGNTFRIGQHFDDGLIYTAGELIWDMSETSPDWGLSSIDSGETGEFVTATIGGVEGRFAHLTTAAGSASAHADIYRGVITTSPVDFPSFTTDDTFTLAVYMQAFSGTDAANANASSTTPYVDLRFSSAAGKEIGGLFRVMRFPRVWQYLTLRAADFTIVTGGELITNDMQRVYVRCFTNTTLGTGAEFYIGRLWKNKKVRPKLTLELDDGWLSTYTQAFPYCLARGVKMSVPLAAEAIGTNDAVYCNWAQVEEMAASGIVEFTIHSNKSHTVELTTYQQVYDDTVDKIARMAAHGLTSRHYVYPQGKFDSSYSFTALNDAGIVTAAHTTGGNNLATSMGITVPMMLPRGTMNHTVGSTSVIASIDKAIALGTTCRLYGHQVLGQSESLTSGDLQLTYTEFATIIDAVVERRDKGLIDVVFVDEWWRGL